MRQDLSNQPQLFDPKTGGVSLLALIGHTAPAPTYPGFIWSDGNLIFSPKKTVPAVPARVKPLSGPHFAVCRGTETLVVLARFTLESDAWEWLESHPREDLQWISHMST